MKQLFGYLIISAAVLLFVTCAETTDINFHAPSRDLKSEILTDRDSSMIIGHEIHITMVNNSLYIPYLYEGYCYMKYDTKTREVFRFKRGQGPGEMLMPDYTISSIKIHDTVYIGLYDVNPNKIYLYEENSLTDQEDDSFYKVISCGSSYVDNHTSGVYILNDSVVLEVGAYKSDVCRISKYDAAQETYTGQETYMKVFTKYEEGNSVFKRILRDGNKFDLSPDKSYIVRITQFGGLIEAYKIENMKLTQLFSYPYFDVKNSLNLKHNSDSRYGYIDVTVSNNKIYALYCGNPILLDDSEEPFKSRTVHVYDRNGKSLEKLLLDKYVTGIAVNSKDTELYALSSAEMDLLLFRLDRQLK
jgi:hypothetical protein